MSDRDNDRELQRRTGLTPERLPQSDPWPGTREGDAPRRMWDPTDPRNPDRR